MIRDIFFALLRHMLFAHAIKKRLCQRDYEIDSFNDLVGRSRSRAFEKSITTNRLVVFMEQYVQVKIKLKFNPVLCT